MLKAFLLSYNPAYFSGLAGIPRPLTNFLDSRVEIKNWFHIYAGTFLLISPNDENHISEFIRNAYPNMFFIIAEISIEKVNGWLPENNWNFIRDKINLRGS